MVGARWPLPAEHRAKPCSVVGAGEAEGQCYGGQVRRFIIDIYPHRSCK